MKITPVAAPAAVQTPQTSGNSDARAKAIAMLTSGSGQTVQSQSSVQPEEMGAIRQQAQSEGSQDTETTEEAVETVVEDTKPVEDPAISRQFAQLARQEKALRMKAAQQDQALKAREEQLKAREAALQVPSKPDYSGYISKDQLKNDALSVLAEAGISYDELTQQILNHTPVDPRMQAHIAKLEAKIQALETGVDETKKSYADQQDQAYKAAVQQIHTDVKTLVYTDPNFEAIKAAGASKDVVDLIEQTYQKDGVLLTNEEACQMVEDYLVEEYTKLTSISKIKNRLTQAQATQKQVTSAKTPEQVQKQPQPMKTLTNANSVNSKPMTNRERAILAMQGKLTK